MSVAEMRSLLGLGKTDSYWLVHQGYFDTILINGKMRIVIDSFEAWYAMQTKHRKVIGEEPGARLQEETLTAREIGELLGISTSQANILIRREALPFTKVHSRFHVPKDAFEKWYASQSRYVKRQEREVVLSGNYLSLSEIARRLNVGRSTAYSIVNSKNGQAMLDTVRVGDRTYVEKDSYTRWLESQRRYKEQRHVAKEYSILRKPKNPAYYTVEEVCRFYGMRHAELYEKLQNGDIPGIRSGRTWRINRKEFDALLTGGGEE